MFAFVIYDAKDQLLFAARDRFGMKPLYYYASVEGLAFASEIKQLVDLPGFSRKINLARTYDYLSVGWTDHTEETMFADARQLRGGQCVTVDVNHGSIGDIQVRRWTPSTPAQRRGQRGRSRNAVPRAVRGCCQSSSEVGRSGWLLPVRWSRQLVHCRRHGLCLEKRRGPAANPYRQRVL